METAVPPFVFAVVGGGAGAEGATAPATMGEQSNIEQDAAARSHVPHPEAQTPAHGQGYGTAIQQGALAQQRQHLRRQADLGLQGFKSET